MSDVSPPQPPQPQSGAVPPPPPPPPAAPGLPTYAPGPGAYGSPYPAAPADAPFGIAALILGIVGLVGFSFCSPIAMILGFVGRSRVKQAPPGTYKTGMLTAGWVMGIVGTVLWVLLIGFLVLVAALLDSEPTTGFVGVLAGFP